MDGLQSVEDLIKWHVKNGLSAAAVTDHDYLFAWPEFYKKSLDAGIKPILGVELCYNPLGEKSRGYQFHTTLLAKTNEGYRNLIKLASEAATTGFYYRPTYNNDMLEQYHEGIIMLSGCSSGYLAHLILEDKYDEAVRAAKRWRELFKDDFYIELMLHPVYELSSNKIYRKEQEEFILMETKVFGGLQQLSRELNIPCVVTNDAHYTSKKDAELHDIVFTMGQRKKMDDDNRYRLPCPEFYLKTRQEMLSIGFSSDVLDISMEIVDKCNVTIEELNSGKYLMPKYSKLPKDKSEAEHLRDLAYEGLREKGLYDKSEYIERLEYELGVINKLGWPSYFLVLADILDFCKKSNIPRGTSRGSAGGSLVSYCIGITKIDPIRHDLLFSRFMSEDRVSMPDIDVDVSRDRRDEVIEYIADTYGQENVCQIGTIGLLATKAAIKKAATVFSVDFQKANLLTSYIQKPDLSVKEALKIPEVAEMCRRDEEIKRVIDVAAQIENMPQFVGQHAAGIIISPKPITEFIPVRLVDGRIVSQWTMEEIESLGALKLDLLGLKTTDLIWDTLAEIKRNRGIEINVDDIPLDDPKIYELLSKGDTNGVFQVESELCKMYLKKMKPKRFEDVENMLALIRPGPLDAPAPNGSGTMVDEFIRRMHGKSPVVYPHPTTKQALEATFGICIYQEQAMRIAQDMAGFTGSEADSFRRTIAKKLPEEMPIQKERFVQGCLNRGISKHDAERVFDILETFAGYSFNKSHSCGYAYITLQTAWLRANYYPEFMASLLTSVMNVPDKLSVYLRDCHYHGVQVKAPSINTSTDRFVADGEDIRFALSAIKGVGNVAIKAILEEREQNGRFKSFKDFILRLYGNTVNKTVVEALIKSGAFDVLDDGLTRKQMFEALPKIIKAMNSYKGKIKRIEENEAKARLPIEAASFEEVEKEAKKRQKRLKQLAKKRETDRQELIRLIDKALSSCPEEFSITEMAGFEKEILGHYVSYHPLDAYSGFYDSLIAQPQFFVTSTTINNYINQNVMTCGYIATAYRRNISTGFKIDVTLEDWNGSLNVIAYNREAERFRDLLKPHNVVVVTGRVIHYPESNMTYIRLSDCDIAQTEPLKEQVIVFVEQDAFSDVQNYVLQKSTSNGEVCVSIVYNDQSFSCGPIIMREDIKGIHKIKGVHCVIGPI